MRIPLSLINSFIDLKDKSLDEIADTLTFLGIEVDAIFEKAPSFSGVISAEVLSVRPHKEKKLLSVLELSDGEKSYSVVTAAKDLTAHIKIAFAKEGAVLKGKKIEEQKIAGELSQGMLASEGDVGLSSDFTMPILLGEEFECGIDLTSILWDPVFELSLTPNLGHCFSAFGVAKELSHAFDLPLKIPPYPSSQGDLPPFSVQIREQELTPRYLCQSIEGVKIAPSPFWLQKILKLSGLKPISNVVDITNYILLKRGQPLHAFDREAIAGSALVVGKAEKSTPFLGLDDIEREVPQGALVISDAKGILALAGVLGGKRGSICEETKNILLEAAFFDPIAVRKAAKEVSLRTDSSLRFEKGIDPNQTKEALEEAVHWIVKLAGGTVKTQPFDSHPHPFPPKKIRLRSTRANDILGTKLSLTEQESLLKKLSFPFQTREESFFVEVPFSRFDLLEEIDLIEEMAKLYGYNYIEKGKVSFPPSLKSHHPLYLFEKKLKEKLIGLGLQELLTPDLISPKLLHDAAVPEMVPLQVLHAKTEEYSFLRTSLLPSFLQVVKRNLDRKNRTLAGFEVGKIHFAKGNKPQEVPVLALVLTGLKAPQHWSEKEQEFDFYDLKGLVENLFGALHLPSPSFRPSDLVNLHPTRQAHLFCGTLSIGSLGEVHPLLLEKFSIKERIFFSEIDLDPLLEKGQKVHKMEELIPFPSSERDWTFSLKQGELFLPILEEAKKIKSPLLEHIDVIDVYDKREEAVKNITLRFTYRDLTKTVSLEEVEKEHEKILSILSKLLAK